MKALKARTPDECLAYRIAGREQEVHYLAAKILDAWVGVEGLMAETAPVDGEIASAVCRAVDDALGRAGWSYHYCVHRAHKPLFKSDGAATSRFSIVSER